MAPISIQKTTSLDQELPPTVESIKKGWLYSLWTSNLISGLLAIIAAMLLVFKAISIKASDNVTTSSDTAIAVFGYIPLFLNVSACMSCFVLIDRLGELPYRAAQKPQLPKGGTVTLQQQGILKLYGIGGLWPWVLWHWLFCFTFGAWSIFAEVLLYIWVHDSREVKIVLTTLAVFCFLPFLAFIMAPVFNLLAKLSSSSPEFAPSPSVASPDIESVASRSPIRGTSPTLLDQPRPPRRVPSSIRFPSSPHRPNHREHTYPEAKASEAMRHSGHLS